MFNNFTSFARGIFGGKKSAKMEARVTEELKEGALRRRLHYGFRSESEYLEHLVTVDVLGKEHVRMINERRLEMVGQVSDNVQTGGAL
ncbi:hypothetical protein GCM10007320_08940 [Pseudorhodoferax aquiterrae]|uniref:Uncharacterized protein n=1 Tax=Pseudorhodoferax aquiterrae TaxID=747304 RepID=A0ABQ3FXJ4_9BURK|nr:hypothetical protein [Pseudorhodoferax aquiterrae]GHC72810.1 hypothetical protein GCM10007320_08940 [Pseudorhodoferax aquiterrae]